MKISNPTNPTLMLLCSMIIFFIASNYPTRICDCPIDTIKKIYPEAPFETLPNGPVKNILEIGGRIGGTGGGKR